MLVVLSGPSCVGKSFAVNFFLNRHGYSTITPYTTRQPRLSESEGVQYHFRSEAELREITANFSQGYWQQPLDNNWYGYTKHIYELPNDPGNWIVQAAAGIAIQMKADNQNVISIFLDYQSEGAFQNRIKHRFGNSQDILNMRLSHAESERSLKFKFDYNLSSDNPEALVDKLIGILSKVVVQTPSSTSIFAGPLSDTDIAKSINSEYGIGIDPKSFVRDNIHGWTIDLTLSPEFYRIKKRYFKSPMDFADCGPNQIEKGFVKREATNIEDGIILRPGEFILAQTNEAITLPNDIVAMVSGRSSYARMGLSVEFSQIFLQAGHDNNIPLQIRNNLPFSIRIYPNIGIAQLTFMKLTSPARIAYHQQTDSKYHKNKSGVLSRFYEEKIYESIREKKPKKSAIPYEYILNIILVILAFSTVLSYSITKTNQSFVTPQVLHAGETLNLFSIMLLTLGGLVRLLIAFRRRQL